MNLPAAPARLAKPRNAVDLDDATSPNPQKEAPQ
jgi:hypothetical protein